MGIAAPLAFRLSDRVTPRVSAADRNWISDVSAISPDDSDDFCKRSVRKNKKATNCLAGLSHPFFGGAQL
jgi:hypothetical protein